MSSSLLYNDVVAWFVRHPKNGDDSKTPRAEIRWDRVRLALLVLVCVSVLQGKLRGWASYAHHGGGAGGKKKSSLPSPATRVAESLEELHERYVDFMIVGFPQGGSVALGHSLRRHGDVLLAEYNGLGRGETDEDAVRQAQGAFRKAAHAQEDSIAASRSRLLLGVLDPEEVFALQGVRRLFWMSAPKTKLLIGIRHPLLMFQTYYNWRVQEWYHPSWMTGQGVIPNPMDLLQGEWAGVSAKFLQFERFLAPLLTGQDVSFPVFLFFQSQLDQSNAAQQAQRRKRIKLDAFSKDLMAFLELDEPIGTFDTMDVDMEGDFPERVDLCQEKHATLRNELLKNAKVTRQYLKEAVEAQRLVVGDKDNFMTFLEEMGESPCPSVSSAS